MRLLSYHIENYGKIHNQDGQFGKGITEFCEKNGYGKTTMASFIRAMFYGLEKPSGKKFVDREHFYPFKGGKFGGNLTFEKEGKTYKIERFFDKKSAKDDELKVYCDGAPFTGFGEDVGKEVFGLDEESFKKTVFITADEIEIESTYSINEKLNRDVEGGEDNDFEAAIAALEKAKKELKAGRGNNDLISKAKADVLLLNDRIKNLKDMSDSLREEYVERERLSKEIALSETALKSASERDLLLQKWETLDTLTAQAEQKTSLVHRYQVKYSGGVPTADERERMRDCLQEENRLTGSLQAAQFGGEKEKTLSHLEEKFKNGAPRVEDITQKQQNLTRLAALKSEREKLQSREQTAREKALERKFSEQAPTEEMLLQKRQTVEEYKRKDAQLKELHATLINTAPAQTPQGGKGKSYLCWALAVACILAGVICFALQYIPVGIALSAVGVVAFLVGIVFMMKKPTVAVQSADTTVQIATLQAELSVLEEKIRAFTVPYGYYGNAGVLYDFATLEEDLRAYREQVTLAQRNGELLVKLSKEIDGIEAETQAFLQMFGEGSDLQNGLNRLLSASAQYASLQEDKAAASDRVSATRARILQCKDSVLGILKKYGLSENEATMAGLNGLEMDCKEWATLEKELASIRESLADYKEKNGLTERPNEAVSDTGDLHNTLSILRKGLSDCDKRIAETEREVEKLPDVESELEQAEEKLNEYKNRYQLLSDTMDALKEAEKSLKDRYIAPIKDKFSVYAEALERVLDEKVTMDSDYRVKFERGGQERSDKHLSAGERSLCALCLRLALIDNMYETEQPFIVMDDPFVHLDKTHMERTAELVRQLANARQIIYFCCHESRSLTEETQQ